MGWLSPEIAEEMVHMGGDGEWHGGGVLKASAGEKDRRRSLGFLYLD